jgi:thioredoxin 1
MTGKLKGVILVGVALIAAYAIIGDKLSLSGVTETSSTKLESPPRELPVKGMVTMVDLGADSCLPCKMMAPILAKMKGEYEGKAAIVFIDVWKDKEAAERFGVRAIPTQIFYDQNGKEVLRHEGFMDEAGIRANLKQLGVS